METEKTKHIECGIEFTIIEKFGFYIVIDRNKNCIFRCDELQVKAFFDGFGHGYNDAMRIRLTI